VVTVTIPGDAFLPNGATGQWLYFNIRAVDPFMDNTLNLFLYYPFGGWTGPRIAAVDSATLMMVPGWFTTAACTAGSIFGYQAGLITDIRSMAIATRCELVCGIASISPVSMGILQCPTYATAATSNYMVTYIKFPEATVYGPNWPLSYAANTPYPIKVSSPRSVEVAILNFGWIINSPMFAIIISYPPIGASLYSLGLNPVVPATWTLLLVLRMDRLTESCQVLNYNPWEFLVATNLNIVQCMYFASDGTSLAGIPLEHVTWGTRIFHVPGDGAVVCWTAVYVSPVPEESGSDNALFGLLALIAVPILLCLCLLALLWLLRPKREPPCCVPEYPVTEMYWVQTGAPTMSYMVNNAAVPSSTPIYVVQ